jgi:hypothetical protein
VIKIQEKYSGEQKIISINVWSNEPDKGLYEVIQIADFVLLYEKSRYTNGKTKCLGLMEKTEAQLHLKYNKTERFFFEPIPNLQDSYTKINILSDLHHYFGVGLTSAWSGTPGCPIDSVKIEDLIKDEIWFVLKALNEKKFITLSEYACITETGRKYLKGHYFDRDLAPKKTSNKTQTTPQTIKRTAGTLVVKLFKWTSKSVYTIIIGLLLPLLVGCY